jgi:hypothetical protein
MGFIVCGALKLTFGSEKDKNIIIAWQQARCSTNLQAKCGNDLCFNRVEIRRAAQRIGRKFKTMEVKYVYKFVSPASYFYISSFPFLQPSAPPPPPNKKKQRQT